MTVKHCNGQCMGSSPWRPWQRMTPTGKHPPSLHPGHKLFSAPHPAANALWSWQVLRHDERAPDSCGFSSQLGAKPKQQVKEAICLHEPSM